MQTSLRLSSHREARSSSSDPFLVSPLFMEVLPRAPQCSSRFFSLVKICDSRHDRAKRPRDRRVFASLRKTVEKERKADVTNRKRNECVKNSEEDAIAMVWVYARLFDAGG